MLARRHFLRVLALLCLGSSIAFAQLTYTTTFLTHPDGDPGGLTIADFDRDGKPDLGVVHGSVVSIFFNQGAEISASQLIPSWTPVLYPYRHWRPT